MRKVASISLALFFLLMSVGVTVNTHYCHSLHKVTTTFFVKKSCCSDTDMPRKCCHNETKVVRLTSNYSAPTSISVHPEFNLIRTLVPFTQLASFISNVDATAVTEDPPPLLYPRISFSVLYRSLLI